MAGISSPGLAKELTIRTIAVTSIISILSYFVVTHRIGTERMQSETAIPLLFVVMGIVMLIQILFCLRKYNVMNTK